MMGRVVCLGDNCIDRYLPPIDRAYVGGNAVNVAVYLQRAGVPAAYMGAVGEDQAGELVVDRLRQEGVDVSRVKTLPGRTAVSEIQVRSSGDREFVFEDPGPVALFRLDDKDWEVIRRSPLVHTTWMGGEHSFHRFVKGQAEVLVSLDYGERYSRDYVDETIGEVDLAFFSLPEEQAGQAQDLAVQMNARGPRLVVVTFGSQGSLAFDGVIHRQPAIPVEVVDTLGAGDAYIGTFLASYLSGNGIKACMQPAANVASKACTHYGGWTQEPLPALVS